MVPYKLKNAAAHKIAVTGTATLLESLIDTAASQTHSFPDNLNQAVITNEGPDDIRFTLDGHDPTSSNGEIIYVGEKKTIDGSVKNIRLIRTGSTNVNCSVEVGWQE